MTYAERELQPFGFRPTDEKRNGAGHTLSITLVVNHLMLLFRCGCPAYPNIKALGCPVHHDGPGGSWPVEIAKRIMAAIYT